MNNEIDSRARVFAGLRILAILMFMVLPATATSAAERPNVVFLLADDLGPKDIGSYGGPVKTPTLDRLAAGGARFTDFHAASSICTPSRASILTGRNNLRTGLYFVINENGTPAEFGFPVHNAHLLEREVTLAEILKDEGYATGHFGKWHLGVTSSGRVKPPPDKHGFDYWFGTENSVHINQKKEIINFVRNGTRVGTMQGTACQLVVDDAISWLDNKRDPDAPFFMNIWFHEPHAPLHPPADIVSLYGAPDDLAAQYSAAIDNTDRAITRLLAKLEEIDAPENTIIIYASDHGSYRQERNGDLRGKKGSHYEGGTRSPGIFYWPGTIPAGHVEAEPASLVDLVPTVCGLLGIDKPKDVFLDGSDLAPLLTGGGDTFTRHQPLFWILPSMAPAMKIRDGNYTMLGYHDYELPRDTEAMTKLFNQIRELVPDFGPEYGDKGIRNSRMTSGTFPVREAERLRLKYLGLFSFRESWIPIIKAGGYKDFELYDLSTDPNQQHDIAAEQPEVLDRLKKTFLEINASVMADAPDWE